MSPTPNNAALIITVKNEESTLPALFDSIENLSVKPSEVLIVDGGSTDATWQLLTEWSRKPQHSFTPKIWQKNLNRSAGRNYAIARTQAKLLAITDAGCTLHQDWLSELLECHKISGMPVVAGFYAVKTQSSCFEQATATYFLISPQKANPQTFLPATRSMLIEKTAWDLVGGFDESLDLSEDYAFAKKLTEAEQMIVFCKKAIVYWQSPETWDAFAHTIWAMARGDVLAQVVRPKVVTVYLRYLLGVVILVWWGVLPAVVVLCLYCSWAVWKNWPEAGCGRKYLPGLQLVADGAVMWGTVRGVRDYFFSKS